MNCSYPYLYRFFKLLFLTIFFLTIIQMFLPVSDAVLIGFCLYGSGIILAGELFRKTEHKREMLITAAVLLVILFLFGYLNREWIAEIYQSYRQELIILLLLPVFVLGISLLEEKLIYSSVLFLFFLIFSAIREIPLSKAGAAAALSFVYNRRFRFSFVWKELQGEAEWFFSASAPFKLLSGSVSCSCRAVSVYCIKACVEPIKREYLCTLYRDFLVCPETKQ